LGRVSRAAGKPFGAVVTKARVQVAVVQVVRWVDQILHREAAGAGHRNRCNHLKIDKFVDVAVAAAMNLVEGLHRVQAGAAVAYGLERYAVDVRE
jgi:hypothetical protein